MNDTTVLTINKIKHHNTSHQIKHHTLHLPIYENRLAAKRHYMLPLISMYMNNHVHKFDWENITVQISQSLIKLKKF